MPRLDGRFEQAKKELEFDPNIPKNIAPVAAVGAIGADVFAAVSTRCDAVNRTVKFNA